MDLAAFLNRHADVIHIRLTQVRGSSPREEGAEIFVAPTAVQGTIGGGQLEYMAIDTARVMLRTGAQSEDMDVPLGPEIGQCCGGRVTLTLTRMSDADRTAALADEAQRHAARPHVYVLGAGHVGRALCRLFQFLPVRCVLIDSRAAELNLSDAAVEKRLTPMPEADIRAAPPNSAFIVLTHDHALDFLLTCEALNRHDAAYVGLIGSATKREKFARFHRAHSGGANASRLICPIGANSSTDKRPEVIAAFVMAEVMSALSVPQTIPAKINK
ncbi:xanthine dehydrogenase accessory protein XdhC [Oceaniglobus ichthyenteri]|uniref:xanthine dehydrogenase accessory protein XdhC n=1 Tax=Oceaniglobus ichthyenteri TaxID=2136177 RepID=UPI000D3424C9|nr:xanthine dehydrogenase accessory protein XdhC [Oceaniglobus ichthyenteri]